MVMPHEPTKGQRDQAFVVCFAIGTLFGIGNIASMAQKSLLTIPGVLGALIGIPVYAIIFWVIWRGMKKLASLFRRRAPS